MMVVSEEKALINRLSRIEGQVRGLKNMVERDEYGPDILIQVSSVNAALNSFSKELIAKHIKGSVKADLLKGQESSVDDLVSIVQKLMK